MAVPKSRIPPRRRGNRRAHSALTDPALTIDGTSGETHRRHHMTPDGYHKGRQVVQKADISADDEE